MDFTQESERDDDLQPAIVGTGKRYAPFQARWRSFWCFREAFMKKAAWLAVIERAVSFTVTGSGAETRPRRFSASTRHAAVAAIKCCRVLQGGHTAAFFVESVANILGMWRHDGAC